MNRQQGMAALAAAATGLAGAAIIVSAQVWAFHYLVHVPLAARWLFALFVAAVGVAAVWLAPRIDWLGRAWDVTRWPAWLMAGVGGATFLLFAERTHYGDGLLKLKLLATATLQDRPPYIWKAPLEGLAGYAASQTAGAVGLPLAAGIVALSVSAGIIYLLAARSIAGSLSPIPGRRLLVFVGLLALGTSQLWFGHIENYSMVTAFVAVTMALVLRFLAQPGDRFDAEAQRCRDAQGGDDESSALPASANLPASAPMRQTEPAKRLPSEAQLALVGLAGGVAVAFHPQALFAMLALPLLARPGARLRDLGVLAITGAAAPLLTVVTLLLLGTPPPTLENGYVGDTQLFWTWAQFSDPQQLAAAWANLWLLVPLAPLLVVIGVLAVGRGEGRGGRGEGGGARGEGRSPLPYLSGVGVGLLFYLFAFQNDLARWQDWDLYAVVGPGVTAWGLALWAGRAADARRQTLMAALLLPGLAFAVVVAGSWVWVNHTYRLLNVDPAYRGYYLDYLAADLATMLDEATVEPDAPICADPAGDPTGCQRVALTEFVMPDTGEARPVIFAHAPASVAFPLAVPNEASFLWVSPALDPVAWGWGGDGVIFQVAVQPESGGEPEVLWERRLAPALDVDRGWAEAQIPLTDYAGQAVTLWLITQPGPANNDAGDRAGWGQPWIVEGTRELRSPP
jgi:hypothetical protein